MTERLSLSELAGRVPDGLSLGIPPDYSTVAMAAAEAYPRFVESLLAR